MFHIEYAKYIFVYKNTHICVFISRVLFL